ncbi:hypothetical protein [Campylobacter sp.]|uniref:hypothetical protein n=1 Tax=Campylobacter sp. TaxID=205 RepID=UPI0025B873E8|nr:hypothetical protein [Campylobacter sp.]
MIAEMPNAKTPFRRILSRGISFARVGIKFQTANRAISLWGGILNFMRLEF